MRQHIALYVNDFTRDYGVEGRRPSTYLLDTAERLGIVPASNSPLYAVSTSPSADVDHPPGMLTVALVRC